MLTRRSLLAVAAALPVAACAGKPPFRLGDQRNGVLLAAKARGAVEAAITDRAVEWTDFPSGPPLLEAMSLGRIDFGGAGDTPPIFAQAAGAKIVYVAAQPVSGDAAAIVVPAASRLTAASGLRGAKLAFTRGSSAEKFVAAALTQAGLALTEVETINLTPTDAATAFAAGAIDAWAIWDPLFAHAEVEMGARVLVSGHGLARSTSFLLANAGFAGATPGLIVATLDALAATAAWAAGHRDALAALIATATAVPPAVAKKIAARQDLAVEPLDAAVVARQQTIADALHASGALPGPVEVVAAMWHGWHNR